jgi:hypothetical protein
MEFVKVTFPSPRGVQMDGAPEGQTGDLLGVQRGHHTFDLGEPIDYTPSSRTELIAGTSKEQPLIIEFQATAPSELAPIQARKTGDVRRSVKTKVAGARVVGRTGKKVAKRKGGKKP